MREAASKLSVYKSIYSTTIWYIIRPNDTKIVDGFSEHGSHEMSRIERIDSLSHFANFWFLTFIILFLTRALLFCSFRPRALDPLVLRKLE